MFKCGICGKEYETIQQRMECEKQCLENQKIVAEKEKKEKLDSEKKERLECIEKLGKTYTDKIKEFIKDYGSIELKTPSVYSTLFCNGNNKHNFFDNLFWF